MNPDALLQELLEHLRGLLGSKVAAPVRFAPAAASGPMWTSSIALAADLQLTIAFEQHGAVELTRVLSNQDEPTDEAVKSSLRALCADFAAALASKFVGGDDAAVPQATEPELIEWTVSPNSEVVSITCATLPATVIVSIAASGTRLDAAEEVERVSAAPAPPLNPADRIDVLLDIDLPLLVRFGCTRLPLKTLSRLGPGSLIDLARTPDDPVELLVGDRIVARGEVVVVSGSYGIRVLELVGSGEGGRAAEM
jgi:flagellar motor switch protein FliN/FliY